MLLGFGTLRLMKISNLAADCRCAEPGASVLHPAPRLGVGHEPLAATPKRGRE
jgi:hypothetical protein